MEDHVADRLEAKVKILERKVQKLQRRSRKVATGFITPYPISGHLKGPICQGEVMDFMFPCSGIISKGAIKLNGKPEGNSKVSVILSTPSGSIDKTYILDKQIMSIDFNVPVVMYDCLEVSLVPDPEHPIDEFWVSFLWKPTMDNIEAMSFLIDKIEEAAKL